jgi:hypothetical protein
MHEIEKVSGSGRAFWEGEAVNEHFVVFSWPQGMSSDEFLVWKIIFALVLRESSALAAGHA